MSDTSTNNQTNSEYELTVGLEIHAELKTKSKMFCPCANNPDEETPNKNTCPICMGHPGTLPVINKEAVRQVIRIGTAIGGEIADFTEFDRKNYFYPDIPKGYQLSQYQYPLVKGGILGGVALTRIHLEEDTAKSSHDKGDYSLVDFNRSSLPLMELVTEPVIHDAKTASNFAKELQLLLRYLGAGEANMEKGEMRVEANISIAKKNPDGTIPTKPDGKPLLGTKVEVKNLNSFKSVERAIEYEVTRHIDMIERGEKIIQETRGFDETTGKTFSQRVKEDSHDYRYFPDPDLPKLFISEIPDFAHEAIKASLPELPWEKRERLKKQFGMNDEAANALVNDTVLGGFFDKVITNLASAKDSEKAYQLATNYVTSDVAGILKKEGADNIPLDPTMFAKMITLLTSGKIGSRGAKDIIAIMWKEGGDPEKIAEEKGLVQNSDPESLRPIVEKIVAENPTVLADYKAGKQASLQFFIGQMMKVTKGSANPEVVKEIVVDVVNKA